MSDDKQPTNNEETPQQEQQPPEQDAPEQKDGQEDREQQKSLQDRLAEDDYKYIQSLREEAKRNRLEAEALQDKLKKHEEQQLADRQEWKQLAEKRGNEVAELREFKKRWEELEESTAERNKTRIEALSEDDRKLVPAYEDAIQIERWLDAFEARVKRPTPPPTDAGTQGDRAVKVSEEHQRKANVAKSYGYDISAEDIAKRERELNERRQRTNTKQE